ncbi:MAG: helix-turn-helix domain-containing protein [Mycobacteriales bacterium]
MTNTAEYVQSASARISALGSAFYFVPETLAVGKEHGLDGLRFYVLGRGGVLGDVEPPVISSAFGYFTPALIEHVWTSAKERADLSPRECGRLYLECAADFGRRQFADVPELQAFCDAAQKIHEATDVAGLALYAGYVAEPLAQDLPGRAMQLVTILREFMGSAHLVAVLAVGLEPKVAHGVRRPEMWESFGYGDEPAPADTEEARALLADADALTQRLITPAYGVLSAGERDALQTGLDALTAAAAA